MKTALIVGGASGIGLAIATELAERSDMETVYIVDRQPVPEEYMLDKFRYMEFDLTGTDYAFFDQFQDIDTLMITAGFGRLALFADVTEQHIIDSFQVNAVAAMRIVKHFYEKIAGTEDFCCGIMTSIAGFMSSPFFSVYAATKAALKIFIESVNVELTRSGTTNRILSVAPGSIKGTQFNLGEKNDLTLTRPLAKEIITHLEQKDDLFIPLYEEVFRNVLDRYHADFRAEGLHSYDYKMQSGRMPGKAKADK